MDDYGPDPLVDIATAYLDYVQNVSPSYMAIGLRAALHIWFLCHSAKPKTVTDFGSGFTSYVLAQYAAEAQHDVEVTSVDDSPEWLDKTGEFLDRYDATHTLRSWDDWQASPTDHDLAVYDLAGGKIREAGMAPVARRATGPRIVYFDDMQHETHRQSAIKASKANSLVLRSLCPETLDGFMRFGAIAYKP